MLADALEHIDQVVVRIDVVQPTGDDQALEDADVPGPQLGPAEQPIAMPHRKHTPGTFEVVGVDRHVRVGEKYLQPALSVAGCPWRSKHA